MRVLSREALANVIDNQQEEIFKLNKIVLELQLKLSEFRLVGWHGANEMDAEFPIYTNIEYLGKNA